MNQPPAAHDLSRPLVLFARSGYAARGVIYIIIGGIALLALVNGKELEGSRGALANLNTVPGGIAVLLVTGIGLLAYAGWRLVQGVKDADHHGHDAKGLVIRAGLLVSAVSHTILGLYAFSAVWSGATSDGGGGDKGWAGWLMSQPWGRWVLAAVGLAVIGAGVAQFAKGVKRSYQKYLRMSDAMSAWASPLCMAGLIARGLVFGIIGVLLLLAAYHADPDQAKGLAGALRTLRDQPYGPWLLGVMALGLLAFAAYSFIEAGWRKIGPGDPRRQAG